jgi:hypothetical protein
MLIAIAALAPLGAPEALAMSVKFSSAGYQACSTRSPAFSLSDVPAEVPALLGAEDSR